MIGSKFLLVFVLLGAALPNSGTSSPDRWEIKDRCAITRVLLGLSRHSEIDGAAGTPIAETDCAKAIALEDGHLRVYVALESETGAASLFRPGEVCDQDTFNLAIPKTSKSSTDRDGGTRRQFVRIELKPWKGTKSAREDSLSIFEFFVSVGTSTATCGEERGILIWEAPSSWRHIEMYRGGKLVPSAPRPKSR